MNKTSEIYNCLKELTYLISGNDIYNNIKLGFTTSEIAKKMNIGRSGVSRYLNRLVKEEKVIKVLGRPVLYSSKSVMEDICDVKFKKCVFLNSDDLISSLNSTEYDKLIENNSPQKNKGRIFSELIGSESSLNKQVKQAKAAILYPPKGLHTLLLGETGTGKTLFAEIMYRYAIEVGRLSEESPFIIFNCADYAGNPQLLLSHLFGYVKGAFTGANKDKKGLIDSADGGILFLDEVHRLPPEGQEMFFSIMDRGTFRRLGESHNTHKANVLILAATTESIDNTILKTFRRRIPCIIKFPNLAERDLDDRMKLIYNFFNIEAKNIKHPIRVSTEVLKLLLAYNCPGNIGQLRNDIQLICANAFSEFIISGKKYVDVKLSQLTDRFKEGIFTFNKDRKEIVKNFDLNSLNQVIFKGFENDSKDGLEKVLMNGKYSMEEDFYENLLRKSTEYFEKGTPVNIIKSNINKEIEKYFESKPYMKRKEKIYEEDILSKIASPEILEVIDSVLTDASGELGYKLDRRIVGALSLHIETLIEKVKSGDRISKPKINLKNVEIDREYKIIEEITNRLEKKINVKIPEEEVVLMAMFLSALKERNKLNYIGILVLCHGNSTASSMADAANTLLGVEHAKAIDMPLDEEVSKIYQKALNTVKKIDMGKGVLLLVDMGSLTTFSDIITDKTGISTKTIRMVSTPMVIEATRKSMLPDMTLDMLVDEVNGMSKYIGKGVTLKENDLNIDSMKDKTNRYIYSNEERLIELLDNVLVFINPTKCYELLKETLFKICSEINSKIDDGLIIKFQFHCAGMLERVLKGETLQYKNFENLKKSKEKLFNVIKESFRVIENSFGITIPDSELCYIVELIDMHYTIFTKPSH